MSKNASFGLVYANASVVYPQTDHLLYVGEMAEELSVMVFRMGYNDLAQDLKAASEKARTLKS